MICEERLRGANLFSDLAKTFSNTRVNQLELGGEMSELMVSVMTYVSCRSYSEFNWVSKRIKKASIQLCNSDKQKEELFLNFLWYDWRKEIIIHLAIIVGCTQTFITAVMIQLYTASLFKADFHCVDQSIHTSQGPLTPLKWGEEPQLNLTPSTSLCVCSHCSLPLL